MKNYIPLFEDFSNIYTNLNIGIIAKIENWLKEYNIENYTINKDLTVDVDGYVYLHKKDFDEFSFQFGIIDGCFNYKCYRNLKTLKNGPKEVKSSFNCNGCDSLKSLEYSLENVGGDFYCARCKGKFIKKY